ncbi:MAG: DUF4886 domain-containing protein [Clostridia bacterium]|nr:DUF4886 domain-containing protein [Clostridia bacterium]
MLKILALGNSFSQDATRFVHGIAEADGQDVRVVNLYIGGCSLERHWNNILSQSADYLLEENGVSTGRYVSFQDALFSDKWDVFVTQQVSGSSGMIETYHPFLENVINFVRKSSPETRVYLHQTWAYEIDSIHSSFAAYDCDQNKMYEALRSAYDSAAASVGAGLIRCGDAVQLLRTRPPFVYGEGGMSVCRDGYHMNVLYGRYLLGAVWYGTLTGRTVADNTFVPCVPAIPNLKCKPEFLSVCKKTADETVTRG